VAPGIELRPLDHRGGPVIRTLQVYLLRRQFIKLQFIMISRFPIRMYVVDYYDNGLHDVGVEMKRVHA
jgi:hypothetical protein